MYVISEKYIVSTRRLLKRQDQTDFSTFSSLSTPDFLSTICSGSVCFVKNYAYLIIRCSLRELTRWKNFLNQFVECFVVSEQRIARYKATWCKKIIENSDYQLTRSKVFLILRSFSLCLMNFSNSLLWTKALILNTYTVVVKYLAFCAQCKK
jgi:hypothetical protein